MLVLEEGDQRDHKGYWVPSSYSLAEEVGVHLHP